MSRDFVDLGSIGSRGLMDLTARPSELEKIKIDFARNKEIAEKKLAFYKDLEKKWGKEIYPEYEKFPDGSGFVFYVYVSASERNKFHRFNVAFFLETQYERIEKHYAPLFKKVECGICHTTFEIPKTIWEKELKNSNFVNVPYASFINQFTCPTCELPGRIIVSKGKVRHEVKLHVVKLEFDRQRVSREDLEDLICEQAEIITLNDTDRNFLVKRQRLMLEYLSRLINRQVSDTLNEEPANTTTKSKKKKTKSLL